MLNVRNLMMLAALIMIVAGCDALEPDDPEAPVFPELSAPTLAPTAPIRIQPPTPISEDILGGPGQNIPEAAGLPSHGYVPPVALESDAVAGTQTVTITTDDGRLIAGQMYTNPPVDLEMGRITPRLPGLLLVGASPGEWGDFPAALRDAGYTVLVVEVEAFAAGDFNAVLRAFSNANTVNPGLMGAIGVGAGADTAFAGCALELLCDTVVLVSPQNRDFLLSSAGAYNPRPALVLVGVEDAESLETGQALLQALSGASDLQAYDGAASGAALLTGQPDAVARIDDWMRAHLVD